MKYAYRVFSKGSLNSPIFGGTVTAESMDDAAKTVIELHKIRTVNIVYGLFVPERYFELNGQRVGIVIYVNPT